MTPSKFVFRFYRFTGPVGQRTTELTRDFTQADGMRGLVDHREEIVNDAISRAKEWAEAHGITVRPQDPFPSTKHPGKAWVELRFGGLSL